MSWTPEQEKLIAEAWDEYDGPSDRLLHVISAAIHKELARCHQNNQKPGQRYFDLRYIQNRIMRVER